MAHEHNPYRLGEDIEVVVPRTDLLREVRQELMSGGGLGYLLGSWGVGKSVFLAQLHKQLQGIPGVQSLFFREPPMFRTIDALCRKLVDELLVDVPVEQGRLEPLRQDLYRLAEPLKVIERYQNDVKSDPHVLVLLYDELNDYVDPSGFGREWFKRIESARKARSARLKVFATGGLGVFDIGESLASPFLSRARRFIMPAFTRDELRALSSPLWERMGVMVDDEIIDHLLLHSGGNAYLAQYGLHELWERNSVRVEDVVEIYGSFRERRPDFVRRFRRAIADVRLSRLPMRFWDVILRGGGKLRRRKVDEIFATEENPLQFEILDILHLLQSAGLIQVLSAADADPILVTTIPSILNFEPRRARKSKPTLRKQLITDLLDILVVVRSMGLDMFRQGGELVQEKLFSALITSNLISRGWKAVREDRRSTGFADVRATHDDFPSEHAIIEVKRWARDFRIHQQVLDYKDDSTTALAAVMISKARNGDWREQYKERCLTKECQVRDSEWIECKGPLRGYYRARSIEGPEVDHFLLQLPRRR
ncbi:hypothetical protein WME79_42550 [Sorangium sp. So ce726]|uniref:hypothetical protein n=1 Tax=Sorangium sp. So ce726 TaxID=3133319 RepID=UPI003F6285F1